MIQRYWTTKQQQNLHKFAVDNIIPSEVEEGIQKVLEILDSFYGAERDVDKDYGGCIYVIIPDDEASFCNDYKKLLDKHKLIKENAEFDDVVFIKDNICWHSELFIASSEYGITFVYPCREER